ncbi:PHD-finger domain-containing protein [Colletotrichum tofieldiae]|uniref:PHD-finger domain-containing protein n=1 Tax=Colletotrichum tofieldiae TaxID=708197 RepID=A0A166XY53_9PEZI|nr:PHD-finger domain-containing protein [Colletotrichum tofieldiae]GKT53105.1 PHD-finger domain-containing protein [Colletotrichum tofieldiae]GKT81059.1 PHD-finger domain-containing protein [Colletotrichum tofieldiae]
MTEPDQCIICLESLQHPSSQPDSANGAGPAANATSQAVYRTIDSDIEILEEPESNFIATLVGCNHVVHDQCIRSWAKNSNTCPICRTPFNEVSLSSELNGPPVDSYAVQDKKQEQEFDIHRWLEENPEDEASEPSPACPICESSDHEEVLLLCDGCNAAYHTHCIGLSGVPQTEYWYCFECADNNAGRSSSSETSDVEVQAQPITQAARSAAARRNVVARRGFLRTQLQARNARREARSLEWQGAWDRIASRIYDATDIDLDNHEDEDLFQGFRRAQAQREQVREIQEHQDWQQRMNIASRLGARDIFAQNIRPTVGYRLDGAPVEPVTQPAPPSPETREEQQAWGALERAREADTTPNARKRKTRSVTASPQEPAQEPERKLKRPRTRRLPLQGEASGSASASTSGSASGSGSGAGPATASASASASGSAITSSPAPTTVLASRPQTNSAVQRAQSPISTEPGPSFLSSLLKEVEMSTPSDDETVRNYFGTRSGVDPSSPVTSPSPSSRNSPRALSLTPPPHPRPSSPTLSLSSYVEPRFPKANYSPTRNTGDSSDSDSRSNGAEIRQPRPQRPNRQRPNFSRSQDSSPTRPAAIPFETKERISGIVRAALKPHWRAQELTSEQYANINRDVSRKLYEGLRDLQTLDEDAKKAWEKIASTEVARAVEELKA